MIQIPQNIISRLAPTPSGFLHKGNIFNFLITWLITTKNNGKLYLRIDDADYQRCKPEYIENILNTLKLLGIDNYSGPKNIDDFEKNYSQQKKTNLYKTYLNKLISKNLIYVCKCSRNDMAAKKKCICFELQNEIKFGQFNLKFKTNNTLYPNMNDFTIWRKDNIPAYHLMNVVEDNLMQCNFIVRGSDLIESTNMQKVLAKELELTYFLDAFVLHHKLLYEPNGQKLSKSVGSTSKEILLKDSHDIELILNEFCNWLKAEIPKPKKIDDLLKIDLNNLNQVIESI